MSSRITGLVEKVTERLRERGETVSFAESCTGGLLSASVTELAGVSDVYVGSIIAYSNQVKEQDLGVAASLLRSMGAVSLPVAKCMSDGVRARYGTTWALSITGIAGPGGGTPLKPVGTVCIGLRGPGVEEAESHLFSGDRRQIQIQSVEQALGLLLTHLNA